MALLLVPSASLANGHQCAPIDLNHGAPADPACDHVPSFKASFQNRVWSFEGNVDEVNLDASSLDMTTTGIQDLPSRFASQDDPLLNQDTHVRFSESTRVYGPDGKRVGQDYLPYAESVVVRGKLVAPRRWASDAEGNPVPTLRAKRLYITDYVQDASDANYADEQSKDEASNQTDDPTPADGVISCADVRIWIEIHIYLHSGS
jgi:hypothetical protein